MNTAKVLKQITELRDRVGSNLIFGSATHAYINSSVPMAEIEQFEDNLGVTLPLEFQNFLLEVGHGAGPYYGIWSPAKCLSEITRRLSDYSTEAQQEVYTNWPFPLKAADLDHLLSERAAGNFCPIKHDWPCSGCVPICDHGCTFWSVLILTGAFTGRVWDLANFVGYDGEWLPAKRPPGKVKYGFQPAKLGSLSTPPTFGEWYEAWIERCFSDLNLPA